MVSARMSVARAASSVRECEAPWPRQHISLDGLTLAFRKAGQQTSPCLILLHGWPQTSLAWEGVLADLGADSYAQAFDLPGVGDSAGVPPSLEKTALADVVLKAATAVGGRSIIVVGYDV